jgi:TolB protein
MVLTIGLMMLAPASAGAFPGRNGKIVFDAPDANLDDKKQIFVMNPDGTDVKELTHSATTDSSMPAWSPDGTEIAYVANDMDGCEQIWVMNDDGSDAHQITLDSPGPGLCYGNVHPSWSPDGTKIAVSNIHTDAGLYAVNAEGIGTPTQLTSGVSDSYPSWSPDGTKIVFATSGSVLHLSVLTVATLSVRQLLTTSSAEPCWSPDGSKIVFAGDPIEQGSGIYWVSASGGTPTLIRADPDSKNPSYEMPDWSPDGTKIAFSTGGQKSIHLMNAADGSNLVDLTPDMPYASGPNFQRLPLVGAPVGGFMEPINRVNILAPYLALFGLVATVAIVVVKPWKKCE